MRILEQFKRSLTITKKDLSIYYLKGPVLIYGILVPSFLFISFIVGRELSFESLLPKLLSMVLFFTVSSVGPVIAPWETRTKTFERLVTMPIALWAIIFGDIIASFLYGIFITFFALFLGVIFLGFKIISLELIIGSMVAAFCFSCMGQIISAPPADQPSNIMMLSTLVKFPLLFISGIFVPISEMGPLKVASFFSPLTYYNDLVIHSIMGTSYFDPWVNLLVLSCFSIIFLIIGIKWHEKSLPKRF